MINEAEREAFLPNTSHVLYIEGESFPVYHLDRRLYKFVDWKDSRDKLIKVILNKLRIKLGIKDAYINFKMANPMRKTRLGNFFVDIVADILHDHKSLGTLEELDLKQIFSDNFDVLDPVEIEMRKEVELKHSSEQYFHELQVRISSLKEFQGSEILVRSEHEFKLLAEKMMTSEGWLKDSDNRIHARRLRTNSCKKEL